MDKTDDILEIARLGVFFDGKTALDAARSAADYGHPATLALREELQRIGEHHVRKFYFMTAAYDDADAKHERRALVDQLEKHANQFFSSMEFTPFNFATMVEVEIEREQEDYLRAAAAQQKNSKRK